MAKRKPKPTRIFREEVHPGKTAILGGSTRTCFDEGTFRAWTENAASRDKTFGTTTKLFVGEIKWREHK